MIHTTMSQSSNNDLISNGAPTALGKADAGKMVTSQSASNLIHCRVYDVHPPLSHSGHTVLVSQVIVLFWFFPPN